MRKLNIGVIGFGGRGHLVSLANRPEDGVRVTAAADNYPPALEDFRKIFGADCFVTQDYRELLKRPDIDAVFITSPDYCHEEHAVAALEAGKAVYLEKPIAITIEGADRILETARRTGSKLYLGHNMRHFPVVNKMKELVDSGIIGEVRAAWCRHFINYGGDAYFKDWHSERKNTCGLLLQKGAHDIDVIHYVTGATTMAVSGMGMLAVYDKCARRSDTRGNASWSDANWPPLEQTGMSPVIDVEDHNMILMQLNHGIQACYMQCHFAPDAERNYTFIGTKGRIENIGDADSCMVHVWTKRGPRATPDIVYHLKPVPGTHGGADPDIVNTFIEFVCDGKKPKTNPVAARNAVAVGVLAHKSMRGGGERFTVPECAPELVEYFENGQVKK
ncbi:MAG: Gfo/Idh/MocA family oxidoreductase [Victivallaceae bacterium]|nr:Gfo/Idh/MocA family oxidoreductase [Victivallaceae bacterium]